MVFVKEDIALFKEEMVQLSVGSSLVVPPDKSSLVCMDSTKKSFNADNFRDQMRSIWKTKKKFDI